MSTTSTKPTMSTMSTSTPPDAIVLRAYATMMKTRLVDDKMITLQRQGRISFALASLGEEACAVGSAAALSPEDWMYPQYREAGILFWRGFAIQDYVDHMYGNANDLLLGRQLPNHFGSRALNIVTVSSPIATQIPHAAGCADAMRLLHADTVAICYFGEGATSEGDFHAGLNFAAVRRAPVIFFCRNNGYAISTPTSCQYACESIAAKGPAYGIASSAIDGNDLFAVYSSVAEARRHCLAGDGPYLLEAITYRLGAHSTSDDPSRYRSDDEVAAHRNNCPILRLRRYLEEQGLWSSEQEELLHHSLTTEIEEAIARAEKTPLPPLSTLFDDVYFELPETLRRQRKALLNADSSK